LRLLRGDLSQTDQRQHKCALLVSDASRPMLRFLATHNESISFPDYLTLRDGD